MTFVSLQVEWKLTRGKWRPNLLDYAKDAMEQAVVDATQKAYASLKTAAPPDMHQVEEALKELTTLKVRLQQPVSCTVSTLAVLATVKCKYHAAVLW